jgi:lysosomal alpha-glucosidase
MDVFVKNATNHTLIGKVFNKSGKTVWPDFSHPNATVYWTEQFKRFHQMVPIDGAWNDMNEISNFVPGSLNGCPNNSLENPPYLPGDRKLQDMTLCMSAKHHAGEHYNVHNLYALYEAAVTNQ